VTRRRSNLYRKKRGPKEARFRLGVGFSASSSALIFECGTDKNFIEKVCEVAKFTLLILRGAAGRFFGIF